MVVGNNRTTASIKPAVRPRSQEAAPAPPPHPVLQLQTQIGNRAVVALLQRSESHPPSSVGFRPVQRQGDGAAVAEQVAPVPLVPPPLRSERQRLAAQAGPMVNHSVAALPPLRGAGVLNPRRADGLRGEAEVVRDELPDLPRSPALASWLRAQQDGGAGQPVPEQRALAEELEAGDVDLPEPAPAQPTLVSRAGGVVQGFFRGVGGTVRGWGRGMAAAFSREKRRDVGAKMPTVGGAGAPAVGHVDYALAAGQGLVDNRATEGTARLVGGATAAGQVRGTGGQIGQVAHTASPTAVTLEHPGDFARSFTAGGFELAHQIAGLVGIFFSALKAALDVRSLVSSVRVIRALKEAKVEALRDAEEFWPDPEANKEVIEMIDYAIRQKYEKVIKRAIGSVTALAALGTALAILIANPVGASLAAVIIGSLGASVLVYKIGRWGWKKWAARSLGKKRAQIAQALHAHVMSGDGLAVAAVRALHLDPDMVARAPNGPALILRKLKSS